jgi:hypothetical protein
LAGNISVFLFGYCTPPPLLPPPQTPTLALSLWGIRLINLLMKIQAFVFYVVTIQTFVRRDKREGGGLA